MTRKTTKAFKELMDSLPSNSLREDMWLVYCAGYLDGEKEVRNTFIQEVEKILISLAYQKVDGKLNRVDINHLDVIIKIEEML